MPRAITMPQQSDTMTEGTLVKWLKKEGDRYSEGEIIAEIETDKATMEMEGPDEPGVVAAVLVKEGEKVPVGATLALIATEAEDPAEVKKGAGSAAAPPAAAAESKSAQAAEKRGASGARRADGNEASEAAQSGTATTARSEGNGHPARPPAPASRAAVEAAPSGDGNGQAGGRIKVSPVARRLAEQRGIDLSQLRGSGPGGRIVQQDVEAYKPGRAAAPEEREGADSAAQAGQQRAQPAAAMPQRLASGKSEVIELSKMRQAIAKQLQLSNQTIPHFYETIDIEIEAAEALRERLNKALEPEGVRISLGDLIAKAIAMTLKLQPVLNSTYDGTTLTRYGDVHLGMAVALDNGLIVPVLRNIDQMGIREIRVRSKDLVDRARAQRLKQDEMRGATFTVSNLGGYGVREFAAIINPPEVGILAIGTGAKRAVVLDDGSIVARKMMTVTLSADHRVVDGADSARFLATLKQMLEEPGMMLL